MGKEEREIERERERERDNVIEKVIERKSRAWQDKFLLIILEIALACFAKRLERWIRNRRQVVNVNSNLDNYLVRVQCHKIL